eukprot:6195089-Pleurochrysis_carterae.AAC.2
MCIVRLQQGRSNANAPATVKHEVQVEMVLLRKCTSEAGQKRKIAHGAGMAWQKQNVNGKQERLKAKKQQAIRRQDEHLRHGRVE